MGLLPNSKILSDQKKSGIWLNLLDPRESKQDSKGSRALCKEGGEGKNIEFIL